MKWSGLYYSFIGVEHRYYGLSQPFGSASGLWLEYLTHEQALADYSALLLALRARYGAVSNPAQP